MKKKMLTPKEMAEILDISVRTFSDYINDYELPFFRVGKKGKRFDEAEVLKKLRAVGVKREVPINEKSRIQPDIRSAKNNEFRAALGLE